MTWLSTKGAPSPGSIPKLLTLNFAFVRPFSTAINQLLRPVRYWKQTTEGGDKELLPTPVCVSNTGFYGKNPGIM